MDPLIVPHRRLERRGLRGGLCTLCAIWGLEPPVRWLDTRASQNERE